jgi:hypothetical protein
MEWFARCAAGKEMKTGRRIMGIIMAAIGVIVVVLIALIVWEGMNVGPVHDCGQVTARITQLVSRPQTTQRGHIVGGFDYMARTSDGKNLVFGTGRTRYEIGDSVRLAVQCDAEGNMLLRARRTRR